MTRPLSICWFRQDLRLADNPALCAAAARGVVLPVFILDDGAAGEDRIGAANRWWLHHSHDYTQWSAEKRLREILPDDAEELMTRRFAIINIWRSIAGRVESHPLAFCDSTSLADGDLVKVTRQAKDRVGQIQMARFNPAHKWYYFPAMEAGEAALIKTYDSATDGRNRFTIHTAFDDPTSPPDAAPRQSIETRCFAFF